ncbi:DUF418 domain-containing protein [Staphylococcus aureus]|uniref:DUF418 domain-containing protein n=1 Tax=Staphylococcus aureus TaxID=1280 RepID=UPI000990ACB4
MLPWGRYGWAESALISTVGIVLLVGFANLWMRYFVSGPLEWAWRSLAYVKRQPLLRTEANAPPRPDHSPLSRPASGAAAPAAR